PATVDEAAYRRVFVHRLEELNFDVADPEKRGSDSLGGNFLDFVMRSTQQPGKPLVGLRQIPDRNTDMFQFLHNWANFAWQRRNFLAEYEVLRPLSAQLPPGTVFTNSNPLKCVIATSQEAYDHCNRKGKGKNY